MFTPQRIGVTHALKYLLDSKNIKQIKIMGKLIYSDNYVDTGEK